MIRLVRAEWTKLFTTRVWIGLLLGACVMVGGFAALFTGFAGNAERQRASRRSGTPQFEQLALRRQATNATVLFLILGIIGMTQEYRHRTATPTFLTEPRRWRVVAAKLVAYALVAVPFALVVLAVNVLVVAVYAGARGAAPSLSGDNLRVLGGVGPGAGHLRGDRRRRRRPAAQPGRRDRRRAGLPVRRRAGHPLASRRPPGAYKWLPGGAAGGDDGDVPGPGPARARGRAACCCSATVCSPRSWARCSRSGATSSERAPPSAPCPTGQNRRTRVTTRMTVQRLGRLIAAGDVDAVRTAVESSPRPARPRTVERDGQGGWTPLHLAVAEGQPDVVRVLVEAGADLTARTEFNRTPLHVALQLAPSWCRCCASSAPQVDAPSAAYLGDVDAADPPPRRRRRPGDRTSGVDLLSWAAFGGAPRRPRELLLERGADADTRRAALGGRRRAGWSWCASCSTPAPT